MRGMFDVEHEYVSEIQVKDAVQTANEPNKRIVDCSASLVRPLGIDMRAGFAVHRALAVRLL